MSTTENGLLYLSGADVARLCAEIDPLTCVTDALNQHAASTARVGVEGVIRWSPGAGQAARTLNMPGYLEASGTVGTKIINANTGNPDRGLPRADGLTILFDPQTAQPQAILQGAEISALRTAAVSTVVTLRLCRSGPRTLTVLGAGKIAGAHVRLMTARAGIDRVLVHDSRPERAQALISELRTSEDGHLPQIASAELEASVRGADILVTATTATQAYVRYEWINSGTVVINVSLDDIDIETYLRADLLYVDDWQLITDDTQRLLGRLARAGRITGPGQAAPAHGRSVTGTLGQLLMGACPARARDADIVLVNPFGMAIEDLAVAQAVYTAARARGLGTWLTR